MTDKQAAQEIYYLATSLRVYIREQYTQRDDHNILSAIQSIQANAIQLGAVPLGDESATELPNGRPRSMTTTSYVDIEAAGYTAPAPSGSERSE